MELNYKLIGERIAQRRHQLGLLQEQVALKVGLSKTHISNIENGNSVPSLETVVKLADVLETTPDAFILGVNRGRDGEEYRRLTEQLLLCEAYDRELLVEFARVLVEKRRKK